MVLRFDLVIPLDLVVGKKGPFWGTGRTYDTWTIHVSMKRPGVKLDLSYDIDVE